MVFPNKTFFFLEKKDWIKQYKIYTLRNRETVEIDILFFFYHICLQFSYIYEMGYLFTITTFYTFRYKFS